MSIVQEIYTWSQTLPIWQQDAIARLYVNRTLSEADKNDLFALAKAEFGIEDLQGRQPQILAAAQVAAPPIPKRSAGVPYCGKMPINNRRGHPF